MKTKLFFPVFVFLLLFAGYVQSQNQQWALTLNGGKYDQGAIIHVNGDGSGIGVAHSFHGPAGYHPYGDLLLASNGKLYGTCYNGGSYGSCTSFSFDPSTGTYTDVYDFDISHGDFPKSGMIAGPGGILYGAASGGGQYSCGVIYSLYINTNIYKDLYHLSYSKGSTPIGNPVFHSNGKLYGLTSLGGTNNKGVIYSFDVNNHIYTNLYSFNGASGGEPQGSLLEVNGKLYGMCFTGGANNLGVIFSFDPANGSFTKLFNFNGSNGAAPKGNLMMATNGLLYGMTSSGGTHNLGVIFSFSTTTHVNTTLYNFNSSDGSSPWGSLSGTTSILYGVTNKGGSNNDGVMFNFDILSNTYTKVIDFNNKNGANPTGGFIEAPPLTIVVQSYGDESMSVFPNPASDEIKVTIKTGQTRQATFTVRDIMGRTVYSSDGETGVTKSKSISLSGISSGSYFIEVRSGNETWYKQVLKN